MKRISKSGSRVTEKKNKKQILPRTRVNVMVQRILPLAERKGIVSRILTTKIGLLNKVRIL